MSLDLSGFDRVVSGSTLSKSPNLRLLFEAQVLSGLEEEFCAEAPDWLSGRLAVFVSRKTGVSLANLRFKLALFTNCGDANALVWQPCELRVDGNDLPLDDGPCVRLLDRFMIHVDKVEKRWIVHNLDPSALWCYPATWRLNKDYRPMTATYTSTQTLTLQSLLGPFAWSTSGWWWRASPPWACGVLHVSLLVSSLVCSFGLDAIFPAALVRNWRLRRVWYLVCPRFSARLPSKKTL